MKKNDKNFQKAERLFLMGIKERQVVPPRAVRFPEAG
jgi:hypothetical protein